MHQRDGKQPDERVSAQNVLEVSKHTAGEDRIVVRRLLLFAELDCREATNGQENVERKKSRHNESQETSKGFPKQNQEEFAKTGILLAQDMLDCPAHRHGCEDTASGRIKQKEEEILVIPKPHTVIDPWAMMVHPENTSVTHT